MRKIGIIAGNMESGGVIAAGIAAKLRHFAQLGIETVCYHQGALPAEFEKNGLAGLCVSIEPAGPTQTLAGDYRVVSLMGSDLVIAEYDGYFPLLELTGNLEPKKFVVDYHSGGAPGRNDGIRLISRAGLAIVHNSIARRELVDSAGFDGTRIVLLPYPVELPQIPDPTVLKMDIAAKLDISTTAPILLVIAEPGGKGETAIGAMKTVLADIPGAVLIVAEPDKEDSEAEIDRLIKLTPPDFPEKGLKFVSAQKVGGLDNLIAACTILIVTGSNQDYPQGVIRGMGLGKTVIAPHGGILPEILGDGGIIYEEGNERDLARSILSILRGLNEPEYFVNQPLPAEKPLRIAFVTPRFGEKVVGGSEIMMRRYAEESKKAGALVEILTTRTDDIYVWNNNLPGGESRHGDITLRRFAVDNIDNARFHEISGRILNGLKVSRSDELEYMKNSLRSGELERFLASNTGNYDAVIFSPYLFALTVYGGTTIPHKSMAFTCLHDEHLAYLEIYKRWIPKMQSILFMTEGEKALAEQTLGIVNPNAQVIGMGIDPVETGDAERFRRETGISGDFILYAGRFDEGKNLPLLMRYFARYRESRPGKVKLVLIGGGGYRVDGAEDVVVLGFVSEQMKRDAMRAAAVLALPSIHESFSIVIMESWRQERPVIVHGGCAVTREHVLKSGGGLVFETFEQFEQALERIISDRAEADSMGRLGAKYVTERYEWPVRIQAFFDAVRSAKREPMTDRMARLAIERAKSFSTDRYDSGLDEMTQKAQKSGGELSARLNKMIQMLEDCADVSVEYKDTTHRQSLFGRLFSTFRDNVTRHLRLNYLHRLVSNQTKVNRTMLVIVQELRDILQEIKDRESDSGR